VPTEIPNYAADGVYRAKTGIIVHGIKLEAGDPLPSDSPLRKDLRRLELLCRQGQIVPSSESHVKAATKKVAVPPTTVPATKPPEPAAPVKTIPVKAKAKDAKTEVKKPAKVSKPKIDVDSLSKSELIKHLEDLGLRTNGPKEQLAERLRIALS